MRRLLPLVLLIASAGSSWAQSAVVSIITPPCHNDGLLSVGFTGVTPPLTVTYTTYGTTGTNIVHTGVTGLSDLLTGYSGGPIYVDAVGASGVHATQYYAGLPPFNYYEVPDSFATPICPALGRDSIAITGGTAPFTFYWFDMATMGAVGTTNPLHAPNGFYGVVVTDGAGCVYGSTVKPESLYVHVAAPFRDSLTTTVASCTNGTASAFPVGGGVAPFSYLWSNGATTPTITSLVMGVYSVKITDGNGCVSDSTSAYVSQSISISAPVTTTPATCTASDGAVIAFGSGGTSPYTYLWNNGATTASQTGLHGGIYTVNVTDANGCIGSGFATVGTSTPITATYTATPSLCTVPNGTATLTLSGGTTPYTIQWVTFPVQTSITATGLTFGTYDFNITDAVGCVQSGTAYIPPIDVISVSYMASPALCTLANGSMTATPAGGVAPYHYLWSTGATTAGITAVPAGTYALTITDNMGCTVSKSLYLPDYSPIGAAAFTTPSTCIFTNNGKDSINVWGGTAPYTYTWSNGGTTRTISSLATGPYWYRVSDAAGCSTWDHYSYVDYDSTNNSCYCLITGTVFADTNNNCTQDFGERGIPNVQIYISGRGYTYTDAAGNYSYKVPAGSYTVSETVLAFYPLAICQANNIPVTTTGGGCVQTVNFANNMDTIHDMHISTWDYYPSAPVVGHPYTQVTVMSNDGTMYEDSVVAGYKTDGQLLSPSFVPAGIFSGAPYWYSIPSPYMTMVPGATQQMLMTYAVPTNIPINTSVVFKDSVAYGGNMSNWLTDYSPWNNVNYFTTITRGSFDPNFKEVNPKGTGPNGDISNTDSILEYMVHFQNTGNYMAENITVLDTLDDNVSWTTMRPEYMSAKCEVTLTQIGTKKVAKFEFRNINLPAKMNDEIRSNGMFTYTVHIKPGLALGTHIRNNASICFDFNAPVKTNTTLNTIGTIDPHVGIKVLAQANSTFNVYPNPANTSFSATINSAVAGKGNITVSDVAGRVLIAKPVAVQKGTQTIAVDVNSLTPGTYFVTYSGNGNAETQKLVIMK